MDEAYFVKSVRVAIQEAQRIAFERWGGIAEIVKVKRGVIKNGCRTVRVRLAVGDGDDVDWFAVTVVKSQSGWVVQRGGRKMAVKNLVLAKGWPVRLVRKPVEGMLGGTLSARLAVNFEQDVERAGLSVGRKNGSTGIVKEVYEDLFVSVQFDNLEYKLDLPQECLVLL